MLVVLERRCDEPLPCSNGLFALIIVRYRVQVRLRHLDVVAEHSVIAHLERGDTGALTLGSFHGRDVLLRVATHRPQIVQLRIDPVANASAVPYQGGRFVDEGRVDGLPDINDIIELCDQAPDQWRLKLAEQDADARNRRHGLA